MNLMRDLAALNSMEMLPWDDWGPMPTPEEEISSAALTLFDSLAALTVEVDESFLDVRQIYEEDARLRVPARVFNAVRKQMEDVATT